jgi:hypothetical protein
LNEVVEKARGPAFVGRPKILLFLDSTDVHVADHTNKVCPKILKTVTIFDDVALNTRQHGIAYVAFICYRNI